jgi:RHS repeat-associated protein
LDASGHNPRVAPKPQPRRSRCASSRRLPRTRVYVVGGGRAGVQTYSGEQWRTRSRVRYHLQSPRGVVGTPPLRRRAPRPYNYTAGQDDGRIASITNNFTGEQVVYTYDTLNRLIKALAGQWGQGFVYDGFGNLLQKNVLAGSAPSISLNVDATTNRLVNTGSSPFWYDNNGNMLSGPNIGPLSYDFLNRVVAAPSGVAYSYGASNRRVWKDTASGEAYYLNGLDGENLGTYTPVLSQNPPQLGFSLASGQERDYFFGKKLFTTEDNVGSAVMALGNQPRSFYPYGEQKSGPTATEQYAFATYWRDGESGLDYAMNRYYSSTDGRFLSPDPYSGSMNRANPQSYNRYAYVQNDPANHNDPSGMYLPSPPVVGPDNGGAGGLLVDCNSDPYVDPWDEFEATGSFMPLMGQYVWCLPFGFVNAYLNFSLPGGGGGGASSPQALLEAAEASVASDLKNPNCAKDFKNVAADLKKLGSIGFSNYGQLQFITQNGVPVAKPPSLWTRLTNPCWNSEGCYNSATGSINLNNNVNWGDPNNTAATLNGSPWTYPALSAEAQMVGASSMTAAQFMDITILHELAHYNSAIGDPDNPAVETQLWNNCIQ